MNSRGIDAAWLADRVRAASTVSTSTGEADRLRELLLRCATRFCESRSDVVSPRIVWSRRGLGADEAGSFLRAVDQGLAVVDPAGYVSLARVRAKTPAGRYALLSKNGTGVSVNPEYLVQIGATAELVLDHGWPGGAVDFERGEFDALCLDSDGRAALAMEAKARVTGPDSLEKLLSTWLQLAEDPEADRDSNAGRKFTELLRLTESGRVLVWLVADGARWPLWAERSGPTLVLTPAEAVDRTVVLGPDTEEAPVLETYPYQPSRHRPGTAARAGHCSWHGPVSCPRPPVISFRDRGGNWQSGCQRAVDELTARGEIHPPRPGGDTAR